MTTTSARTFPALALFALLAALVAPRPADAHEGHHHQAMGTVAGIDAAKLVLDTTAGERKSFVLTGETRYQRGPAEAKREDVVVGERAVVVYETKESADRALEVRLAAKKP